MNFLLRPAPQARDYFVELANILAEQVTEKLEVLPGAGVATRAMKEAFYK